MLFTDSVIDLIRASIQARTESARKMGFSAKDAPPTFPSIDTLKNHKRQRTLEYANKNEKRHACLTPLAGSTTKFPTGSVKQLKLFFAKRYRDAVCAERCAVSPRTTPRAKEREKITPSKNIDIRLDFAVHRFSHRPNSCFDPSSNGKCPEDAVFCKRCTANFSID